MLASFCWISSVLGLAVTGVVLLGNAMCTVPIRLSVRLALALAVLPTISLYLGYLGLNGALAADAAGRGWLIYGVALLIVFATIVLVMLELSSNWVRSPDGTVAINSACASTKPLQRAWKPCRHRLGSDAEPSTSTIRSSLPCSYQRA